MSADNYHHRIAFDEMQRWQKEMIRKPGFIAKVTRSMQKRLNRWIPEKAHQVITTAIRHAVQAMLKGSEWIGASPLENVDFYVREARVKEKIHFYKNTAAAEGAITGAGGILLSLADFPLWLSLKMKMLTDIALLYGYDVKDFKERVYLLHIFQLSFSGRQHRREVFALMADWDRYAATLPDDSSAFDWRSFQQEYRDYIDIAKLLQLVPGIGAFVGAYVNHNLTEKLGITAMNAYRMRHFSKWVLKN
ncbi:MAG TPA: EcsC family protein [Flavipsychrobacter sp.]|nr:EcsC family protein [Flavipsychrobacter sp.]